MKNVVLITGATSGIGLACAKKFAENGYNLIITGRRNDRLNKISKQLKRDYSVSVLTLNFDVRDKEGVKNALTKSIRIDTVKQGIKVTQIAPGTVETEFSVVRFKGDKNKADSVYKGFEPLHPEDIATAVYFATTLPAHANINDLVIMPTAQANATILNRE